jgi:hypothetical protein
LSDGIGQYQGIGPWRGRRATGFISSLTRALAARNHQETAPSEAYLYRRNYGGMPMNTAKKNEPEEPDDFHNPLWIVVGGMAWLFGVLIAIMALGGGN